MNVRKDMEKNKRSLAEKFDQVKRGRVIQVFLVYIKDYKLNPEVISNEFARSVSMNHSQGGKFQGVTQSSIEEPKTSSSTVKRTSLSSERTKLQPINIKKTSKVFQL